MKSDFIFSLVKRASRLVGLAFVLLLEWPLVAVAQAQPPAAVGRVLDISGLSVPGAVVTLRRDSVGYVASTHAAADGRFRLEAPEAGSALYEIVATAPGFSAARRQVRLAEAADLRLVLRPGVFTDEVMVIGTRLAGSAETVERIPGSIETINRAEMETSRVVNINEGLRKVTGVNVRDEEGLALRPNIGLRGLNPTRSSKVLLLEDGIFVTYAPYGDNATYYHPPVERFYGIEVVKGAGQIAYGPVTVGGVINYLTPAPPDRPTANIRLASGNREYRNGQATAGGTWGRTAVLAEYMRKQGDGSRDHIHSSLNDANLKAILTLSPSQTLTLKANYYGEDSQITYSGLTLAEWERAPRGNVFENDAFKGERFGGSAKHTLLAGRSLLTTHAYASKFSRDWWRQSSNSAQRPNDRADPACGGMANLLTTCGNEGRLRDFTHYGVESRLRFDLGFFGLRSEAEAGMRAHHEIQERIQENGATPTARTGVRVEDNRRTNSAYSAFVQDRLLLGPVTLSAGARFESVKYERTNRLANGGAGATGRTDLTQWVPGLGLSYKGNARFSVFVGAHRGFAPPRTEDIVSNTGGTVDLKAEKSWNYEAGLRSLLRPGLRFEATVFRNDFENQIIPASLAGGVGATLTNGGATLHQGFEMALRVDTGTLLSSPHNVFVRAAFTALPTARFEGERYSGIAGFSARSVSGNRLPYAPETTLTSALGYRHPRGVTVQVEAVHVSEQFADDLNTRISTADGQRGLIPTSTVWNLALNCDVGKVTLFVTAKNVFDELSIVDRSRGIIPGSPRLVQAGIVTRF